MEENLNEGVSVVAEPSSEKSAPAEGKVGGAKLTSASLSDNKKAEGLKASKSDKADKKKKKKDGFFQKLGRKFKEIGSELKLVTWPKFPKVVKQTGVVLLVVVIFLVLIALFDWPLSALLQLIAG